MNKTDNRHYNNTSANKNLHLEMDLWIAYKKNNEQPILIGVAIAPQTKGYSGDKYEMWYAPSDTLKGQPFLVRSEKGITDYLMRSETIKQAKYYLAKHNPSAKWQRKK